MIDTVEILTHWYAGRSQNELATSLGVDRKTLRKYTAPARAAGMEPTLTSSLRRCNVESTVAVVAVDRGPVPIVRRGIAADATETETETDGEKL